MQSTKKNTLFSENLKIKARHLKNQITAVYYAYKDPRIKFIPKLIIAISIGYALSPIDLIPDFIPIIGYLDDLIVIPALLQFAIKLIPKNVMEEAIIKAKTEPLKLKRNWVFASIVILVWLVICIKLCIIIIKIINKK